MADDVLRLIKVLPQSVRKAYDDQGPGLNFGLRMTKAVRYGKDDKGKLKFEFYRDPRGRSQVGSFPQPPFSKENLDLLKRRNAEIAATYPQRHFRAMKLSSRLVIGMGHTSVYETGMTLHPVYGIPYLPASSLKGVTRRRYIEDHHDDNEATALADQTFCDLFGCTGLTRVDTESGAKDAESYYRNGNDTGDRRGALVFLDAFPTGPPTIEVDIITPHYKPYYENAEPPADIYDPVPINFLTVAPGSQFEVAIALDTSRTELSQKTFDKVVETLVATLTEDGIGGKTTVGYGRFFDVEEEADRQAELEALKEAERQAAKREQAGITRAQAGDYVSLTDLKAKRGAYRVSVKVVGATHIGTAGKYVFEPLVEELRGKRSQEIFVNLHLEEGDRKDDVEISGVNTTTGKFTINQKTVRN